MEGRGVDPNGTVSLLVAMKTDSYTHSPALHPNLLLGSLQLLLWLLVHPSAWCHYVARIAPTLRPDFTLMELTREQWRLPALRQLLVTIYGIWPVLTGLITALILWLLGESANNIIFGAVFG